MLFQFGLNFFGVGCVERWSFDVGHLSPLHTRLLREPTKIWSHASIFDRHHCYPSLEENGAVIN
jgi:hypothetical protein